MTITAIANQKPQAKKPHPNVNNRPSKNQAWASDLIYKFLQLKSGFCTHFSGKHVPEGISEEEWVFKYNFIKDKFHQAKMLEINKITMDTKLSKYERQARLENIQIEFAFKVFQRVNKRNDTQEFIDLTCLSTNDARMIVVDHVIKLAKQMTPPQ